jgi:flagellar biogenesis protein FliO
MRITLSEVWAHAGADSTLPKARSGSNKHHEMLRIGVSLFCRIGLIAILAWRLRIAPNARAPLGSRETGTKASHLNIIPFDMFYMQ